MNIARLRVQRGNHSMHLQTSLVQSFGNFEETVQIIALKRFGGAPHYNQLAPLSKACDWQCKVFSILILLEYK
jgi:hypothetical protein